MSSPLRPGAPGYLEKYYIIDDPPIMAGTKNTQTTPRRSARDPKPTKPFGEHNSPSRKSAKRVSSEELSTTDPTTPIADWKPKKRLTKRQRERAAAALGFNLGSDLIQLDNDDMIHEATRLKTSAKQDVQKRKASTLEANDDELIPAPKVNKKRKTLTSDVDDDNNIAAKAGKQRKLVTSQVNDDHIANKQTSLGRKTLIAEEINDSDLAAPKAGKKRKATIAEADPADLAAARDLLALSANKTAHLHPISKKRKVKHETSLEAADGVAELAATANVAQASKTRKRNAARANNDDGDEEENDDDDEGLNACEGHATGRGTTSVAPSNATIDEPWHCANRDCSTGMTYFERDEVKGSHKGYGRKTISDYLGRNKKETKSIDNDVWHIYCRKCYQRLSYQAEKAGADAHFRWHIRNLRIQFARLRIWRPEATFKIQLVKSMIDRGNEYQTILRQKKHNATAAMVEYTSAGHKGADKRKENKKGTMRKQKDEEAFPVAEVDNFISDICGNNKSYVDVENALQAIEDWYFVEKTLTQMPPVEFLISKMVDGDIENDTAENYQSWLDQLDEERTAANILLQAFNSPSSVRMSTEGPAVPLPEYKPPKPFVKKTAAADAAPAPIEEEYDDDDEEGYEDDDEEHDEEEAEWQKLLTGPKKKPII